MEGGLFWYDIASSKILAKAQVNSQITAPLLKLDINNDNHFEIIAPTLNQSYGVYESSGQYLFKGRAESPVQSLIAKPIPFEHQNKTYILLVDQAGEIELVESSYGKTIWHISLKLKKDEGIVASPILEIQGDRRTAFIAGTKGNLLAINVLTGQVYWQKLMESGFISTGVLSPAEGSTFQELKALAEDSPGAEGSAFQELRSPRVVEGKTLHGLKALWNILSVDGDFLRINARSGDILLKQKIGTEATSSLAGFQKDGSQYFVLLGKNGSIQILKNRDLSTIYHFSEEGPFQSSPIISDLNGDKTPDIIAVQASGKIVIVDIKGTPLGDPYYLKEEVTATPLLITANNKTHLVVASEGGKLFVLALKKRGSRSTSLPFLFRIFIPAGE